MYGASSGFLVPQFIAIRLPYFMIASAISEATPAFPGEAVMVRRLDASNKHAENFRNSFRDLMRGITKCLVHFFSSSFWFLISMAASSPPSLLHLQPSPTSSSLALLLCNASCSTKASSAIDRTPRRRLFQEFSL